jgi:hypothetical protein
MNKNKKSTIIKQTNKQKKQQEKKNENTRFRNNRISFLV